MGQIETYAVARQRVSHVGMSTNSTLDVRCAVMTEPRVYSLPTPE